MLAIVVLHELKATIKSNIALVICLFKGDFFFIWSCNNNIIKSNFAECSSKSICKAFSLEFEGSK